MFSLLYVMARGYSSKNFFNKSVAFRVPDSSNVGWPLDTIYGSGSWLEEMWAGGVPAQNLAAALHGWAMGRRSNFCLFFFFFTTQWLSRILWLMAEKKKSSNNTFRAEKLNH